MLVKPIIKMQMRYVTGHRLMIMILASYQKIE